VTTAAAAARPRNRKQLIIEAAGQAFSERGYHAASMEEIAAQVGITAAALYRHFPNKYALLAECANVMADRLVAALDETPPEAPLTDVLAALTRVTVAHRASGGLYRWEARYLDREDRRLLKVKFTRVVDRVTEAVRREYPLPEECLPQGDLRAVAALGAIGSVTMYHTSIARRRIEDLLLGSAMGVVATDRTRRAEILTAAIPLFARDGFANVTNGQIADTAGLVPSAIYRHYPAKVDILAAACLQAAGLLAQAVERSLRNVSDPREAVMALAATYVAYSFEYNALNSVAEAEVAGMPPDRQRPLILAQRDHIAVWVQQLRAARPELDPHQARMLVHAGFGVVVEVGRRLRWQDSDQHRDAVTALVVGALLSDWLRRRH
jgi:AcrR family transcriptional regulator